MKKIYILDCIKIIYKIDAFAAAFILVLKAFTGLIPAIQTILVARFIDKVTRIQIEPIFDQELIIIISCMVITVSYSWITKSINSLLEQHIEMKVRAEFKPELVEKIGRLKYEHMENSNTRDLISRVHSDVDSKIKNAYMSMLKLLELLLKVGGILIIMFTQVWWVAVLIMCVSLPCFYIAIKSGKNEYDAEVEVTKINRMNEYFNEMLKGREYLEERTLFQFNKEYIERFSEQYEIARKYKTKVRLKWFLKMKAGSMTTIIVSGVLILVLVPLTLKGLISVGMFMALINAVFNIVQNMSWDLARAIDRNTWFSEYFKDMQQVFLLKEDELSQESQTKCTEFTGLEFRNVSFKYPGTENYILKDLSFKIEAGRNYALVGSNGAGKSTIIKLINRLYDEYEGEILVNGQNIKEHKEAFIATVFQDFARYPLSLKDNICIVRKENVLDSQLNQIIKDSGLEATINKLPNGIETYLGKYKKDSLDLSGGEWQKIALARCSLSMAPFKILDEPTAAMDPIFETKVYENFKKISENKTILLISHRLSSIKMSDVIFVLKNGSVLEEGTHQQLMEKHGLYKTMYVEQAKWYEEAGRNGITYE